jgi:Endonuclease NucS
MSPAIWRRGEDDWHPLLPSGFPSEEALHDLVEEAPHLLPLSGDPTLTVLGREVTIGPGYADLLAVDTDGRLTIIEIKLRKNTEARRAVVAQILTYAAYLKGMTVDDLEASIGGYLSKIDAVSIADAAQRTDQSGQFDAHDFTNALEQALRTGSFRLVLVLDETPSELVQLVGYLESISTGVSLDLVTVSSYDVGSEQILIPQRVDPDYTSPASIAKPTQPAQSAKREVDGSDAFKQAIERASAERQASRRKLLGWARELEAAKLATLRTVFGQGREILLVWVRGEKSGLVTIWHDNGVSMSLWRSALVRFAWEHIQPIEKLIGGPIKQGGTVTDPSDELCAEIAAASSDATQVESTWNGSDFYISFGEDPRRVWDDTRRYGFVAAGGGKWYPSSLGALKKGHRVFVYIPKGNGVGGYIGVGEVPGEAALARDFRVDDAGQARNYLDVATAPEAGKDRDDPDLAEWVVPVKWIETRDKVHAVKDPDFFANQNSAVKLTHGHTKKTHRGVRF